MAPAKRRAVIDLTGDDERPTKLVRRGVGSSSQSSSQVSRGYGSSQPAVTSQSTPPSSLGPSSQYIRALEDAEDEDYDEFTDPIEFYGTTDQKIVGVRYYNGLVTPGEAILCIREPRNQYDPNAIRVDNIMGAQIGHIPRNLAAKLAPYLDRNEIILEGVLNGHKGPFDCPIRLYFYGLSNSSIRLELERKLKADKLLKATELKNTRKEAEARRAVAQSLKGDGSAPIDLTCSPRASQQAEAEEPIPDILGNSEESNLREVAGALDSLALDEATLSSLPMATQPDCVVTKLLPYQLQGLAWLTAKEAPTPPAPGSTDVVQLWMRTTGSNFKNLISSHVRAEPPSLLSGGILADDMGLGKTLQMISLILTNGSRDGPTLIVAPVSALSVWRQQVQQHVKADHAKVLTYHNIPKGKEYGPQHFGEYNIVVTSYGKVTSEFTESDKPRYGLFSVKWRRLVLDEGHKIRNSKTKVSKAVCKIQAKSRWLVSGTPIVNTVYDFLSLLQFLRITGGVEQKALFAHKIGRPLEDAVKDVKVRSMGEDGASTEARLAAEMMLKSLMQDLCLRRNKKMAFIDLRLPSKTEFLHQVKLYKHEQEKYEILLSEARGTLQEYQDNRSHRGGSRRSKDKKPEVKFASVLERLLRLRQMCDHWTLCGSRVNQILSQFDDQASVDIKAAKNRAVLQKALQEAYNTREECPVCYEPISTTMPVITACKHRFCKDCITKVIQTQRKCPMCRESLSMDQLLELDKEATFEGAEAGNEEVAPEKRSAKVDQIRALLQKHLADPKSKVVVFSQWTKFLDILQGMVAETGWKSRRLEGCMRPSQREEAVESLNEDAEIRVMLVSLNAASEAVNLNAADTVILSDSWWAPAIEDQAIDRVHRLGQQRPVNVYKLVVDDSVEYRVLDIQKEKRNLVSKAFQDGADAQTARDTKTNVRRVLGLA
ncbi:hypothetical protein GGR56DRAFT_614726 [Xylariaceae sp. FL0804]|nr:hypothetical protein GGR56DRAFT_614726 [Xylariaceae sp. FL0804]